MSPASMRASSSPKVMGARLPRPNLSFGLSRISACTVSAFAVSGAHQLLGNLVSSGSRPVITTGRRRATKRLKNRRLDSSLGEMRGTRPLELTRAPV